MSVWPAFALALTGVTWGSIQSSTPASRDFRKLDVCALAAAADVARAAGGAPLDTRPFNAQDGQLARCVYGIEPAGAAKGTRTAYVIELFPANDFDELRPHVGQPVTEVSGIGDGAYEYRDPDSNRWRIYVRRHGDVTISVTGPDQSAVRKVAALAWSRR